MFGSSGEYGNNEFGKRRESNCHGEDANASDDEQKSIGDNESLRSVHITDSMLKQIQKKLCLVKLSWPETILDRLDARVLPVSYTSNSNKEKLLLWYTENFRLQYHTVHSKRKPLLLACDNEYGIQKFVSTTIRPSVLGCSELHDWQGCTKFIRDHLTYEPLKNAILMPEYLCSPTKVLLKQKGHSFEMSTVLVSILLGQNYNAYVVSGYASREQVNCDYTRRVCLYLPNVEEISVPEKQADASKYRLKQPPVTTSRFLAEMEAREQTKLAAEMRRREEEQQIMITELEHPEPDELWGYRVHAWVVILPNEHEQPECPIFLEPSSGEHYDPTEKGTNELYFGVESIWNHQNYWVNVQSRENDCASINWDLTKPKLWEHLLPGEPWEMRGVEEDEMDDDPSIQVDKHLDMPSSWVQKIEISSTAYEQRYPGGRKTIHYKKTKVELFAPYLERDGLVQRITIFDDYDYSSPMNAYETYANRTDNLVTTHRNFETGSVIDYYKRGRPDACKEHHYRVTDNAVDAERTLHFYDVVRVDGLTLLEVCPTYIRQYFVNRKDHLCYRNVEYVAEKTDMVLEAYRKVVWNITEKFLRNGSLPANKDVAVREFALGDNEIRLKYHYEKGRATRATRTFKKPLPSDMGERLTFDPNMTHGYNPDPMAVPEKSLELFYELDRQLKAEAACMLSITQAQDEIKTFLKHRERANILPNLSISLFDRNRNDDAKAKMFAQEAIVKARSKREIVKDVDYLGPYLARLANPKELNRNQAYQVREDCLADFRKHLVDRANVILRMFEQGTEELKQKHDLLSQTSGENKEKLQVELNDLTFDLHALDLRLNRHRELAPRRYRTLVEKLEADDRLAILRDSISQ